MPALAGGRPCVAAALAVAVAVRRQMMGGLPAEPSRCFGVCFRDSEGWTGREQTGVGREGDLRADPVACRGRLPLETLAADTVACIETVPGCGRGCGGRRRRCSRSPGELAARLRASALGAGRAWRSCGRGWAGGRGRWNRPTPTPTSGGCCATRRRARGWRARRWWRCAWRGPPRRRPRGLGPVVAEARSRRAPPHQRTPRAARLESRPDRERLAKPAHTLGSPRLPHPDRGRRGARLSRASVTAPAQSTTTATAATTSLGRCHPAEDHDVVPVVAGRGVEVTPAGDQPDIRSPGVLEHEQSPEVSPAERIVSGRPRAPGITAVLTRPARRDTPSTTPEHGTRGRAVTIGGPVGYGTRTRSAAEPDHRERRGVPARPGHAGRIAWPR